MILAAGMLAATACSEDDESEPGSSGGSGSAGGGGIALHLEFDTELPVYKNIEYSKSGSLGYDVRYIVEVYEAEADGSYTRVANQRIIQTQDNVSELDCDMDISLGKGTYHLIAWSDYVEPGSESDCFYSTSDFSEISLLGDEHIGSNDYRDVFRGSLDCEVTSGTSELTIQMSRPTAKFTFTATDLKDFINAETSRLNIGTTSTNSTIDLSEYSVMFFYSGFMPRSFNLYTDNASNSAAGVSFSGEILEISESEVQLGFDYMFVNESGTSVSIALGVYDSNGDLLSDSTLNVPLERGKETVVSGNFLTSKTSGNLGVSTEYNGGYTYIID